jgi:hypothetical protein
MPGQGENSMDSNKPSLDHLRENWKAQLEDIAVYFPDEYAMTNALHDIDAQIVLCLAFKAAQQLIIELEQRNKDLETVVKTVHGDMEARPDTLAELGHERGLDMLQWLNNARRFDIQDNKNNGAPGSRHYVYMDLAPLQQLAQRGYATIDADTQTCRVTDAGMDYIKALKHDLRK